MHKNAQRLRELTQIVYGWEFGAYSTPNVPQMPDGIEQQRRAAFD